MITVSLPSGPSYAIDTACSSSMFALQQALTSIRSGQCDAAIVGGTNLLLKPNTSLQFHRLNMLSPQGMCKAFDSAGEFYVMLLSREGFVWGDGTVRQGAII